MTSEQLKEHLMGIYAETQFEEEGELLSAIIPSNQLHKVAEELQENEKTQFNYLFCLTGVDFPEYMQVVYHLKSTELDHSLVLKAKIEDREDPHVDSVYDLWKTAEFHEREAFDLFGIKFDNHPDLRRIFLEDDWVGFPLRKDYVDEINIVEL
ncbi:MAG: NADH-quinone oxidoreductase subunit C [Saprospiraceae bacterium]|nr:NADH-quinone oxidoreductase subunit C [Saprospiraceae bacterium]